MTVAVTHTNRERRGSSIGIRLYPLAREERRVARRAIYHGFRCPRTRARHGARYTSGESAASDESLKGLYTARLYKNRWSALNQHLHRTPLLHTRCHTSSSHAPRSISRTKRGCRGPALATAESKPNVPRDRPYMSAQARSERRPSSLRAAHGLTSGRAARITQGDAPTSPTPARTADRECSHSLRVMRRRLRERSRAPAGAADLLRLSPSHAGTPGWWHS